MKYSQLAGVIAAVLLMFSGLLNWAWFPDLKEYFTGFYSYNNTYGKPGKVFIVLGSVAIIFYLVPRIWSKRVNMFVCVLILAYAIKTFILYSGCYRGVCPEKQAGLWIMLFLSAIVFAASLLPDINLKAPQSK